MFWQCVVVEHARVQGAGATPIEVARRGLVIFRWGVLSLRSSYPIRPRGPMSGTIRFVHDHANDVHIAYVKWLIETEGDCRVWHKQLEEYFTTFGRKIDIIYVCDDLRLGSKIG